MEGVTSALVVMGMGKRKTEGWKEGRREGGAGKALPSTSHSTKRLLFFACGEEVGWRNKATGTRTGWKGTRPFACRSGPGPESLVTVWPSGGQCLLQ